MILDVSKNIWHLVVASQKFLDYNDYMIGSKKQSIEDIIVEILAKNPYLEGLNLVLLINKIRANTTKQAVYTALKFLLESEVVAKVGSKYFLSRLWLNKVNRLFEIQKEKEVVRDAIFDLKDKESITYHFPSLLTCDTYWGHIANLLIDWVSADCPVFIWNPHNFFVIGRNEVEKDLFKAFERNNKYGFYTTRGNTALDREFKKSWTTKHVSVNTDDTISFPNSYYLNVFGHFVIEIFIDEKLKDEIDSFYGTNEKLTPESILLFEKIISKRYPIRMKISNKNKKAIQLRKKLSKDFFIPKELKIA